MGKEKIITIILGLSVGILLAIGYFFGSKLLPKNLNSFTKTPLAAQTTPTPTVPTPPQFSLLSPEDNSLTNTKTINISGQAMPNTPVILFGNADEQIATADATGKFQAQFALEEGENEISATSFDSQEKPIVIHRNVTLEITP